jgi:hypothetical protein
VGLKLYKVYLVYGNKTVLQLYWAEKKEDVYTLMNWKKQDKPKPIIEEIVQKEGCCLCHHLTDFKLCQDIVSNHIFKKRQAKTKELEKP